MTPHLQFEHPEDRRFFIDRLAGGDEQKFEAEFLDCFDFREPAIKRKEFKALRNRAFRDLLQRHGETCQLRIHADCGKDKRWEVDHIVPLATNELNTKLRNMALKGGVDLRRPLDQFSSFGLRRLFWTTDQFHRLRQQS